MSDINFELNTSGSLDFVLDTGGAIDFTLDTAGDINFIFAPDEGLQFIIEDGSLDFVLDPSDSFHFTIADEPINFVLQGGGGTSNHSALDELDYASAGHTGFSPDTHTIVSHDTDATGAELNTLTDTSDADALHTHDLKLDIADIDDTPVNEETEQPISSNWAFDHDADADAHHNESHNAASHSDISSSGADIDSAVSLKHAESHTVASHASTSFCFFTAATGSGVISNKSWEANTTPANKILTAFESDNDDITVTIEIHALTNAWMPDSVTVSGAGATPVQVDKQNFTQVDDTRIWTASVNLSDADTTGTLTATMSDGDTDTCSYTRALDPPLTLTAVIDNHSTTTGGDAHCPLSQTQVKQGDTLDISGTAEAHADEVYVINSGVTTGVSIQGPFTVTAGAWTATINVGNDSDATSFYTCYAKVAGGTPGANKESTESVDANQTSPTFSAASVAYPGTQLAIKDAENVTVTITHTNIEAGDTYLYDDNSTSELTIPNTTTYQAAKANVARASGDYRISGTNYKLTVTRTLKNGKSATKNTTVKISNSAAVLTMTGATSRLRSQEGDGQTYALELQSDIQLKAFDCERDAPDDDGTAIGSWSGTGSGDTTWTYNLVVNEADTKNVGADVHTWASVVATSLSEKTTNSINTNPTYVIGGFESRDVSFAAFEEYNAIGTMATNKDNANLITCEIVGVKELTYVGNTTPAADKFTTTDNSGNFDADGTYVRCLDADFIGLGLTYDLRTEETVS